MLLALSTTGCASEKEPPPSPERVEASAQQAEPAPAPPSRESLLRCEETATPVPISAEELSSWEIVGPAKTRLVETPDGSAVHFGGTEESPDSIVLLSPNAYAENVVFRFQVMFPKAKSIAVTVLSASTPETGDFLNMPDGHPDWFFWGHPTDTGAQSYLFSIHTEFHQRDALLRKRPGRGRLDAIPDELGEERRWYSLEMGKIDDLVWMDRDGEPFLEATDPEPLPGGRMGFMFAAEGMAGFQIRDLKVLECP